MADNKSERHKVPSKYENEPMLSDIRNNSLTGMMNNKANDKAYVVGVVYGILALIYWRTIHQILMNVLKINTWIARGLILIALVAIGAVYVFDIFVFQRKKRDKQITEVMARSGDMINYFMRIKEITRMNFGWRHDVTVVEGINYQMVPIEITYREHRHYADLLDGVVSHGLTFNEYELRGRITLFDNYRERFSRFTDNPQLTKALNSIYVENERVHRSSTSRRLYLVVNIPYSKSVEEVLTSILRQGTHCGMQFLTEPMYKEMVEQYFGAPVNLERMRASVATRQITLEETMLVENFKNLKEAEEFLRNYKTIRTNEGRKFRKRRS